MGGAIGLGSSNAVVWLVIRSWVVLVKSMGESGVEESVAPETNISMFTSTNPSRLDNSSAVSKSATRNITMVLLTLPTTWLARWFGSRACRTTRAGYRGHA